MMLEHREEQTRLRERQREEAKAKLASASFKAAKLLDRQKAIEKRDQKAIKAARFLHKCSTCGSDEHGAHTCTKILGVFMGG
jgi:hypothetical protein